MNCLYPLRLDMKKIAKPENIPLLPPYVDVPCGKCIKCLLDKNYEWQFRGYCEMLSKHSVGCFLTLTYDDENNPLRVSKRHMQLFLKRLKEFTHEKFTYMCTSEYGEESMRPHYHLLLFGLDLSSFIDSDYLHFKRISSIQSNGQFRFQTSLWKYGHIGFAPLDVGFIKYTLKYLLKGNLKCGKYRSYNDMLEECGFEPNFFIKSQGIGKQYFDEHIELIQEQGGLYVGGKFHTLPPYWAKKYDVVGITFRSKEWFHSKQFHTKALGRPQQFSASDIEDKLYEELKYEKKPF